MLAATPTTITIHNNHTSSGWIKQSNGSQVSSHIMWRFFVCRVD
jgi:hypothetical protein